MSRGMTVAGARVMKKHPRIMEGIVLAGIVASACTDPDPERSVEPPTVATEQNELICGANTVASATTPSGNRAVFCVVDNVEVIAETGHGERIHRGRDDSALDIFLSLTDPATPVPSRLVESCMRNEGAIPQFDREIVDGPVFAASGEPAVLYATNEYSDLPGSYCDSTGATRFSEEWRADWCLGDTTNCKGYFVLSAEHSRSWRSVDMLGQQVNEAIGILASCGGPTKFTGLRDRGAEDDGYFPMVELNVASGKTWTIRMWYADGGADAHFKFTAQPLNLPWLPTTAVTYRTLGRFIDDK